jgi:prepilin-type N-terminal cleavage/methylation domain-containing protein
MNANERESRVMRCAPQLFRTFHSREFAVDLNHCGGSAAARTLITRHRKRAFTLLELLVVVSILAVLAGLLLPVLHRAQAKAQGINCLNNLRQMQMAWQMYTDDHAGWVPENQAELYRGIWRSTPNSWTGPSSAPFDTDTFAIE